MKFVTGQNIVKKVPAKVLRMLQLSQNEIIQFHIKISFLPIFVNDVRKARTNFIITTQNIMLVDYYRFPIRAYNSFREQDVIPLSTVTHVMAKMKKYTLAQEPLISFATSTNNKYEMVFYRRKKCLKIYHEIVNIIKKENPKVECKIAMPDPDSYKIRPEW